MNYLEDPTFIRQLIMDHYEHPRNKRQEPNHPSKHVHIDSCIDDITVQCLITDGIIKDVSFVGKACTIATASTSMMTELLVGKSVKVAYEIIEAYNQMIHLKEFNEELVGEAVVFKNVGRQANRVNCATLGWKAMTLLINENGEES